MQHAYSLRAASFYLHAGALILISACAQSDGPTGPQLNNDETGVAQLRNPIAGLRLYVDPYSRAKKTADAWRSTRPADALQMDKIATQSQASWFGGWSTDIRADVSAAVSAATSKTALPVLVAYNIPLRDCGSYSAGGASSADAYRTWINAFANGIGTRRAVVILEPDALAGMGCLTTADRTVRSELLSYAVRALKTLGATTVYLDAGNSRWQTAGTMAQRLTGAGIAKADGFSLNVSNFLFTSGEVQYGAAISQRVGGKHYVIDTSRNGLGPTADYQWCNPDGRALGRRPTTNTDNQLVDAYLWVKLPGESDGACNGNPKSGAWMPEYALGLASRSAGDALMASLP